MNSLKIFHKTSDPDRFIDEFYLTFKEEIPILHKHLQKIEEEGRNTSELTTLIPKPDKDFTRKQNKTTDQYPS